MLVLKDATVFKNVLKAMSILDEPIIRVSKKGLRVRQQDITGVEMIDLEMPAKIFENYECTEDEFVKFDFNKMSDTLQRVKTGQSFGLSLTEENTKIAAVIMGASVKTFTMDNIAVTSEEKPMRAEIRQSMFKAKIKLDVSELSDGINDIASITTGKAIGFDFIMRGTEKSLEFTGLGEGRTVSIDFRKAILAIDCKEVETSKFGVTMFKDIIDSAKDMAGVVNLWFTTDRPVRLDFELPFEGTLVYYLAPIIDKTK